MEFHNSTRLVFLPREYYQFASRNLAAYFRYGIFRTLYISAGHNDRRSSLGQLLRRLLADAGVGAGHEEYATLQIAGALASSPGALSALAEQADEQDHRQYEVTPRRYHNDRWLQPRGMR